jgi:hypothetical protein
MGSSRVWNGGEPWDRTQQGISKNTKWSKNVQENSRTFLHHKNVQDFPAKMLDIFPEGKSPDDSKKIRQLVQPYMRQKWSKNVRRL